MTNYDKLLEEVRALGMDFRWSKMFVKKLSDDEKAFPVSREQAEWALSKGFYPGRITLYGLTEENYKNYVPDFGYFMLHPLNNHFLKWLDKTTLKYVLNSNGCESTMPKYYVYVENDGSFTYLMDAPDDIEKNEDFLLNLLKREGILAMKPNSGTSGGLGFIKLELKGENLYENNKQINIDRVVEIRNAMRNYVITEYAKQHSELAAVWPESECTLRVIMAKSPKQSLYEKPEWTCVVSFARFGASISGGASNLSTGGVGVGFDFETGKYNDVCLRYKRFCEDGNWRLNCHPDTGVEWHNKTLPNWEKVKGQIADICDHVSSLDYLGLDIIITEDGMKLCEINSHPALDYAQLMSGPALAKEKVREFFVKKGIDLVDNDGLLKAYIKCQE
ncbi:MAG: hypothetical protein E7540_00280 [Ruminococcaceae bacterium]|nr:hypothetical protein [Oscillospiraceae bacterium]